MSHTSSFIPLKPMMGEIDRTGNKTEQGERKI